MADLSYFTGPKGEGTTKGKKDLEGKVEPSGQDATRGEVPLPGPGSDMTGTWGSETNPGGGGGKQDDCH